MAEIQVSGKTVHYSTGGRDWQAGSPTLVMLHGAGGNQSNWTLQARHLAHLKPKGWNVAALDLPGHGPSGDQPGLNTMEAYGEWLEGFRTALGVEKMALVGHSMGAGIALTYAATHPESVSHLALVGSALSMKVNPALLKDCLENPAAAHKFITLYGHGRSQQIGGSPSPGIWNPGVTHSVLSLVSPSVLHRDFSTSHSWDGAAYTDRISCPTLVVIGEGDMMTPPKEGHRMAGAIKEAQTVTLADTGHFIMTENPRGLNQALRSFLNPSS